MRQISRARLALILALPAVSALGLGIVGFLIAIRQPVDVETRLTRIGDLPAFVIIGDGSYTGAVAWPLLFGGLGLLMASILAWWLANRTTSLVDEVLAAAAEADVDREQSVQEVVHELRTPLAVMSTNLELAATTDEGFARYLDASRKAVVRMARVVDDLDGYGGLTTDRRPEAVDVSELVRSVTTEFAGPAAKEEVSLLIPSEFPSVALRTDSGAVVTALSNLISNAVRLSPPKSSVRVVWGELDDEWVWITVADDGPGLPRQHHALAFERGWQGSHDRRILNGSSGLGLTIARQLIEAQGGALTVISSEGAGAEFTIWLPASSLAAKRSVVAADGFHPAVRPWTEASKVA